VIQTNVPSRRLTSRVEVSEEVWVYWSCDGREDVSRVRNLSLGGLFVETSETRPVGIKVNLHFLVQEGQIRADALVRHATATSGLGMKFLAVKEADRHKLASLVKRLRTSLRPIC
jgi:c-di-GMP-binding flagellar brake protein YcgR